MNILWSVKAKKQLEFWEKTNHNIKTRIFKLLDNIQRTPFEGIGKPEALKHQLGGLYSRRITSEHRLIYSFNDQTDTLEIESCKGHYKL